MSSHIFQQLSAQEIIRTINEDPDNRGQDVVVLDLLEEANHTQQHDKVIKVCAHIALNVEAGLYKKGKTSPLHHLNRCANEVTNPVSKCTAYHAILLKERAPQQKEDAAKEIIKNLAWHPDFDELCFYLCDIGKHLPETSFTKIYANVLLMDLSSTFDGKTSELQTASLAWEEKRYMDLNESCDKLGKFVHLSGTENTKTILTFAQTLFTCNRNVSNINVRHNVGEDILSVIQGCPDKELGSGPINF